MYDAMRQELVAPKTGIAYPIIRGIPRLVPSEARLVHAPAAAPAPSPAADKAG